MTRRRALLIAAAVLVVVLAAGTVWFVGTTDDRDARATYDAADRDLQAALDASATARDSLAAARQEALEAITASQAITALGMPGVLVDLSLVRALAPAAETLATDAGLTATDGGYAAPAPEALPAVPTAERPTTAEALRTRAEVLRDAIPGVRTVAGRWADQTDAVRTASGELTTAVDAVLASAAQRGAEAQLPVAASADTSAAYTAAVTALGTDGADPATVLGAYRDAWLAGVATHEAAVRAAGGDQEPTYIRGILVVNKTYGIPSSFGAGLTAETSNAFASMQAAAKAQGLNIYIASGFRSYSSQTAIYGRYASNEGTDGADRHSARAGHSEHQTGLTFDLNSITEAFGSTPAGIWVAEHAHEYGFIVRYPQGKESITGYVWEPWHLRYLGTDVATEVYESGQTLEEYLGVTSAY